MVLSRSRLAHPRSAGVAARDRRSGSRRQRRPARALLLALVVTGTLAGGATTATPTASAASRACTGARLVPSAENLSVVTKATHCLVNRRRKAAGRKALKSQPRLRKMGKAFAAKMVREGFFDHTSPDGATFERRLKASSYTAGRRAWSGGENLAWGTGEKATPRAIVASWMASPGHRKNLLARGFRDTGLAIAIGAPDRSAGDVPAATYVQEFGRRR